MAIKSKTQRTLLLAFVISIACCGATGIYCLLVGRLGWVGGQILATTSVVGAASILGLVSAIPWERRRWHPIGPVALAAVAVAFVLLLIIIWGDLSMRKWEALYKATFVACVAGVALPHVSLLSLSRLRREYGWVRRVTIILIALLGGLISIMILAEQDDEFLFRLIGILAIGDVCGTVTVPILHRVSAIRVREGIRTVELELSMTCPRCGRTQTLPVGRCKCTECGLKFNIEIEEEHCTACGYPLYRLESAACPECGTPIAQNATT